MAGEEDFHQIIVTDDTKKECLQWKRRSFLLLPRSKYWESKQPIDNATSVTLEFQ